MDTKTPGSEPRHADPTSDVRIARNRLLRRVALSLGAGVAGLWFVVFLFSTFAVTGGFVERVGQMGDSFGALNTFFSGLAFVGVIMAILMQASELDLQYRELVQAVQAHQSQADSVKGQLELQSEVFTYDRKFKLRAQSRELYARWNNELWQTRRNVQIWLHKNLRPTEWMNATDQGRSKTACQAYLAESGFPTIAELRSNEDAAYADIYRLLNFFEQWTVLQMSGDLDTQLLRDLLRAHPHWWKACFIRPFRLAQDSSGRDAQLLRLLTLVEDWTLNYDMSAYEHWAMPEQAS